MPLHAHYACFWGCFLLLLLLFMFFAVVFFCVFFFFFLFLFFFFFLGGVPIFQLRSVFAAFKGHSAMNDESAHGHLVSASFIEMHSIFEYIVLQLNL